MRPKLIAAVFSIATAATAATAQTPPGPEAYDDALVQMMAERYPLCTTPSPTDAFRLGHTLATLMPGIHPEAADVPLHTRAGAGFQAVERALTTGHILAENGGFRMLDCPASDAQMALRYEAATLALQQMDGGAGMRFVQDAFAAHGCVVTRAGVEGFVVATLEGVAAEYEIILPEPLPQGEHPGLTPLMERMLAVMEDGIDALTDSGALSRDDRAMRLLECDGEAGADGRALSPDALSLAVDEMAPEAFEDLIGETMSLIGCSLPDDGLGPFGGLYLQRALARHGVEISAPEVVTILRAMRDYTDSGHPYGPVAMEIARGGFLRAFFAQSRGWQAAGGADGARRDPDCTPAGDLTALDPFVLE